MKMAAAAQHYAPKKSAPERSVPAQEKKPGLKNKLQALPFGAGIAAMILLLAISLPVGNFRALQNAAPGDFYRQGDVQSIIEERIAQAGNVVTVATRAGMNVDLILDVENARQALSEAKSARNISRLDQKLTAAVAELTTAEITDSETRDSMQRAADNFAEQGNFLRQEARNFNKQAEKAEKLYESLPMKFLLPEPDVYEGI